MPISYKVTDGGMFVHATATGILTPEEVWEYMQAQVDDERIKPGFRELFDAARITESRIDAEGVRRITEVSQSNVKKMRGSKLAIVVGRGESFDRARYYEKIATPRGENVIVFNAMASALQWLGVNSPEDREQQATT